MDFFSAGGFQRLFKDLEYDEEFIGSNNLNDLEFENFDTNWHNTHEEHYFQDIEESSHNILNINAAQQEIVANDWLPGTESDSQHDLLQMTTEPLITQEIEEWEDKFLDNFIEIPELVNILPEKTPLCTDTCDLFLKESAKNLKLNRKNVENDTNKGYMCTFNSCCKIYAKPAHLKAHLRRHLGEKPYACTWPNCTWKFSRSDELARHRRSHSGIKPYKCNYCAKCFARSDHLTKHRKVHERRILAANEAGVMPPNVYNVRPGRRKKNSI